MTYQCIICILLLLVSVLVKCQENGRTALRSVPKCSRPHSKFVREYFARALLPIYQKFSVPVPDKCPFSPLHDIYHFHENNKTKLDTNKWKCEICGKMFVSEKNLDKHFDKRHNSSLQLVLILKLLKTH